MKRKNTRRFDPRYFMEEKTEVNKEIAGVTQGQVVNPADLETMLPGPGASLLQKLRTALMEAGYSGKVLEELLDLAAAAAAAPDMTRTLQVKIYEALIAHYTAKARSK